MLHLQKQLNFVNLLKYDQITRALAVKQKTELDLSKYDVITASERLFDYVCKKARRWGMDPAVECVYMTPASGLAKELGPFYRVMWEAGPYEWGVHLSLGGVTFVQHDGPFDKKQPAVVMGEPNGWYLQPHYSFDVGFIPSEEPYWNIEDLSRDESQLIVPVTGSAAQALLFELGKYPEVLRSVNRRLFEELVAEVFHGFGYQVELTQRTRDGGKDIIALKTIDSVNLRYLIECKRPDAGNPIRVSTVRELLGVSTDDPATKSLLVTSTHFTPDAKELLDRHKWRLEGKEYNDIIQWAETYVRIKTGNQLLG